MWALSKMLHCGPWPYGYKSCLSTTCCLFNHMEFWDIPRSPTTPYAYVCVCVWEIENQFQIFFLLSQSFDVTLCWNGDQFTVGLQIVLVKKKCEKCCLMPKKKENPLKWVTGYLQDALSIVTAYTRIGSRCKVNSIFQSESELSIHSLLSLYWVIYWMSALHTRPVLQNTLSHPRAHVSLLRKLNEWFISGGA